MENITAENYDEKVSSGTVLVDIWDTWCAPCKMLSPILDEVSNEFADVSFLKLQMEPNLSKVQSLHVASIPTLILYKDGKEVSRIIGYRGKAPIVSALKTLTA